MTRPRETEGVGAGATACSRIRFWPSTKIMTNRIALALALLILVLVLADHYLFQWGLLLFLGRQFATLIEWVSFWR